MQPPIQSEIKIAPAPSAAARQEAFDASWFKRDHRIHVEGVSTFYGREGNYLSIHPEEGKNLPRLAAKILKHLSVPGNDFFSDGSRLMTADALAAHIPISNESRKGEIRRQIEHFLEAENHGKHPEDSSLLDRYQHPFSAYIRAWREDEKHDPDVLEYMKNAMVSYMVLDEALKANHHQHEAAMYVRLPIDGDGALGQLFNKVQPPLTFDEYATIAHEQGVEGIAQRLGVSVQKLDEIKGLVDLAAEHQFSANMFENWNEGGKHAPSAQPNESLADYTQRRVQVGLQQRAQGVLFNHLHDGVDTMLPKESEELVDQVVGTIRRLPIEIQKAHYYSGTEIGLTSAPRIDPLVGRQTSAAGQYVHSGFDALDTLGVRQIFVSNAENRYMRDGILNHELSHIVFPTHFTDQQLSEIDQLLKQQVQRLSSNEKYRGLVYLCDEWYKQTDRQAQAAIEDEISQRFGVEGFGLKEALGGQVTPEGMEKLRHRADHALHNLNPHSRELSMGYNTPELRAAEAVARYVEFKRTGLNNQEPMAHFLMPQMEMVFQDYYLPHLEKETEHLLQTQPQLPEDLRYIGLPVIQAEPDMPKDMMGGSPLTQRIAAMSEQMSQPLKVQDIAGGGNTGRPMQTIAANSIAAHIPGEMGQAASLSARTTI